MRGASAAASAAAAASLRASPAGRAAAAAARSLRAADAAYAAAKSLEAAGGPVGHTIQVTQDEDGELVRVQPKPKVGLALSAAAAARLLRTAPSTGARAIFAVALARRAAATVKDRAVAGGQVALSRARGARTAYAQWLARQGAEADPFAAGGADDDDDDAPSRSAAVKRALGMWGRVRDILDGGKRRKAAEAAAAVAAAVAAAEAAAAAARAAAPKLASENMTSKAALSLLRKNLAVKSGGGAAGASGAGVGGGGDAAPSAPGMSGGSGSASATSTASAGNYDEDAGDAGEDGVPASVASVLQVDSMAAHIQRAAVRMRVAVDARRHSLTCVSLQTRILFEAIAGAGVDEIDEHGRRLCYIPRCVLHASQWRAATLSWNSRLHAASTSGTCLRSFDCLSPPLKWSVRLRF